ncbi:MAG: histidine kinase [Chitinophagaceae bacterium]|jgi:sensor histidine kinase YesM|nr:histidine kinase [Chitinophagaceae bacterium]
MDPIKLKKTPILSQILTHIVQILKVDKSLVFRIMKKQIIKTAFITSPVISFLVVAPIFIVKTDVQYNFISLWCLIFFGTFLCWLLNLFLLKSIKIKWLRFLITYSSFLLIGTTVIYYFRVIPSQTNLNQLQILLYRSLSLLSINLIITVLIDLIVSKEKQLLLNKEIADLKFANLEAQYKLLKDQINPHFIFNALNISKSLIKKQPEKAEQYLLLLASFIRSSIDYNHKSATLSQEINLCNNYINLQMVRFGDALQYATNNFEENKNKQLPFFALVTLLENAIKHNSFTIENPLKINIYLEDDCIIVQNNKQPKIILNSEKSGLNNINERSKFLNGNEIQIIDEETSFTVKIKLLY